MKFALPIILLLVATQTICAQVTRIDTAESPNINLPNTSSTKNLYLYSIGLRVYELSQMPKLLKQQNDDFKEWYLSSYFFKFHDNQIRYRIGANYYKDDVKFNNVCLDCETAAGKLTDFGIKVGFEKVLSYSVVQPYFGFDIGYRKNRFKGMSQNAGPVVVYTTPYEILAEKNGGVFAPLAGVNFNLINHLTIGVEANLDIMYNYERREKTMQDAARSQTFANDRNWEFLAKPVSVFLQYNFELND